MAGGEDMVWGVVLTYVLSAMLVALALHGLSRPDPGRTAVRIGIAGMALAIATTLFTHNAASLPEIGIAMLIGGGIGLLAIQRVAIAALPQWSIALHGLAGLAAIGVGGAAWLDPGAFGIAHSVTQGDCGHPCGVVTHIASVDMAALALGMILGGVGVAASLVLLVRRGEAMAGACARVVPGACSGAAAVLLGLAFQNIAMIAIGALLTGASAAMLRQRVQDGGDVA